MPIAQYLLDHVSQEPSNLCPPWAGGKCLVRVLKLAVQGHLGLVRLGRAGVVILAINIVLQVFVGEVHVVQAAIIYRLNSVNGDLAVEIFRAPQRTMFGRSSRMPALAILTDGRLS